ncbi:MAG: hypothetical protein EXS10_05615 [Phycisphaerales bacterium]|nr:hypothetical protein [Phycisphaerales bacterium]
MTDAINRNSKPQHTSQRGLLARLRGVVSNSSSARTSVPKCVVEVTEGGARAIEADVVGGMIAVRRAWEAQSATTNFFGESALDGGALLCISRLDAMLRTIALPTDNAEEIRDMARLALLRDLPVEGAGVTDYLVLESQDGASTIVGAAVSASRLEALCALFPLQPSAASVRTLGTLELLRSLDSDASDCVLAIDCVADRVEFLLVENGAPVFSRAADIGGDVSARSARVLVETRRALLALRSGTEGREIARALLLSDAALASEILPQLEAAVGCSASRLETHPRIRLPANVEGEIARSSCFPLAGLLLARIGAARAVDFVHPAQPLDRAARTRKRALTLLGVAVLAVLSGWTAGSFEMKSLQARADDLREKATTALPELQRAKREEFRLKHIALWLESDPAWMDYLAEFRKFAPDTREVVLDGLSGVFAAGEIEFTRDKWEVSGRELKFTLDGEAKDRATADALRDALVASKALGVTSTGADARGGRRLPYPFAYVIRTTDLRPNKAVVAAPKSAAGGSP